MHHSAPHIDWLVNSRGHRFDMAFSRFSALLPVYLIGLAQPSGASPDLLPMLYTVIATTWSFVVHANLNWRQDWLERLEATPAFHHWQHNNEDGSSINKNDATSRHMDRILCSHDLPSQRWPLSSGLPLAPAGNLEEAKIVF